VPQPELAIGVNAGFEVDETFLVVTFFALEVMARWMAFPAPTEAPVQREACRCR
jgi:uncharacterized membrane protein